MNGSDALMAAAVAMPGDVYAVIDGGRFDDIDQALAKAGLAGRALYLEGADPATRAAAGYLVALLEQSDLRAVVELAGGREALVLWSWPAGFMALYRHLRTLNLVEMPTRAHSASPAADGDLSAPQDHETVLFRHWDPKVLAAVLPLLAIEQQARFFRASQGVVVHAHGQSTVFRAPLQAPDRTGGRLRFSPAQMQGLQAARAATMALRVETYLREFLPDHCAALNQRDLIEFCRTTVAEGISLGIEQEGAHCRWAYLQLSTHRRMLELPGLPAMFTDDTTLLSVDDRVRTLFRAIAGSERTL
jgi:hypothetical protein